MRQSTLRMRYSTARPRAAKTESACGLLSSQVTCNERESGKMWTGPVDFDDFRSS